MPDFTNGQFPSLDGSPEAEVAQRTEPATDGNWFKRVFTVHNRNHTRGLPDDHESHLSNFTSVLQQAVQQGLHPKSAPLLLSEQDHPSDPNSTDLTYAVQVVPAVADIHPETTVTPSNLAQVLAYPDSLAPVPVHEVEHPTRWEQAERDSDGPATSEELSRSVPLPEQGEGGVVPATETPTETSVDSAGTEGPKPAAEPLPTPTE